MCHKYKMCDDCPLESCPTDYCNFAYHNPSKLLEIAMIAINNGIEYKKIKERLEMLCEAEME